MTPEEMAKAVNLIRESERKRLGLDDDDADD